TPREAPFTVPSGGRMSANDTGGTGRLTGNESAVWETQFPLGLYRYGVRYVSGQDPASFDIQVLADGTQINEPFTDTVSPIDRQVNFSIEITRPQTTVHVLDARATKSKLRPAADVRSVKPAVAKPAKPAAKVERQRPQKRS